MSQDNALFEAAREPAIALACEAPPRPYTAQASRAGGAPALPSGAEWPRSPSTGVPLHFLAQINLGELPSGVADLPASGFLFFFARMDEEMLLFDDDPDDYRRVLFTSHAGAAPSPVPDDLPDRPEEWPDKRGSRFPSELDYRTYPPARLIARAVESYADWNVALTDGDPRGGAFQQEAERRRVESLAAAFGADIAALASVPRLWGERPPDHSTVGIAMIPPDLDKPFPQIWAVAEAFARETALSKMMRGSEPDALLLNECEAWITRARSEGTGQPVPMAERHQFRAWFEDRHAGRPVLNASWYIAERAMEMVHRTLTAAPELIEHFPAAYLEAWRLRQGPVGWDTHYKRPRRRHHQMFGHVVSSQDPPVRKLNDDELLLLQLISDPATNFMFCDLGELEFTISRNDLANRRFDRCRARTQGG